MASHMPSARSQHPQWETWLRKKRRYGCILSSWTSKMASAFLLFSSENQPKKGTTKNLLIERMFLWAPGPSKFPEKGNSHQCFWATTHFYRQFEALVSLLDCCLQGKQKLTTRRFRGSKSGFFDTMRIYMLVSRTSGERNPVGVGPTI